MKLIIDIPEGLKKDFELEQWTALSCMEMKNALINGTPLDKHDEEVIAETVESIWGKPPYIDVLDKIKAEIEQNAYPIVHGVNNHEKGMTLYGILQVIDKYRGEQCQQ